MCLCNSPYKRLHFTLLFHSFCDRLSLIGLFKYSLYLLPFFPLASHHPFLIWLCQSFIFSCFLHSSYKYVLRTFCVLGIVQQVVVSHGEA